MARKPLAVRQAEMAAALSLVQKSGAKIRVRSYTTIEYVWRCPNVRCPKSKLAGAITGTVYNWVVMLAAQHLQGDANKKQKLEAQKAREQLLVAQ